MTDKGGKLRGSALQGEDRDREGGNDNVLSPLSVSGASSDAKKASGSHRVHDNAEKERPRTQKLEDRGRASGDTTSPSVAAGAGSGPSDPGAQEGIPIRNKRKHEDDSGGSMKVAAVGQDRANPASKDASPAGLSGGLSRDASADAIIRAAIESGEPLIPFLELIGMSRPLPSPVPSSSRPLSLSLLPPLFPPYAPLSTLLTTAPGPGAGSPGRSAESTDVVQKLEQAVQRATARGITEEEKAVFRSYIQLQVPSSPSLLNSLPLPSQPLLPPRSPLPSPLPCHHVPAQLSHPQQHPRAPLNYFTPRVLHVGQQLEAHL